MEGVLLETENMLAHGRMDLPLSLWFATLRGNDNLLQKFLKEGKVVPSLFPPKPICLFPFISFMCFCYRYHSKYNQGYLLLFFISVKNC